MFRIGGNQGRKNLEDALKVLNDSLAQPHIYKRRVSLHTGENLYLALKALCHHRGVTITKGHDEILRRAIIEEYKRDIEEGKLKFNAPEEPVQ